MKHKTIEEKKNIVILGGGFAGIRAALDLNNYLHDNSDYQIILVDRKDYQCYHPGLYEAATTEHGLVEVRRVKRTVAISLAQIFYKTKVKVFKAYIDRIALADGKVITDSRILSFDYLVVAMGSIADFYDIPGLDKHGYPLKNLDEAIMIRNRIEEIVIKKDRAQFIIGGGGFAGTELAGELHNLLKHECEDHGKKLENFKIIIVEGGMSFLGGLSEKVAKMVGERLTGMGVETRFSSLITEAAADHIIINMKDRINSDLLIWTGGVRSIRLPVDPPAGGDLAADKKDRIITTDFLNLKHSPNIFIAGDNLCFTDPATKKSNAQTGQEAVRHGALVAKNIFRLIKGRPLLPYSVGPTRFVIPVSGKYAILYTPNLLVVGFWGWLIRKGADLRYFWSVLPLWTALKYWLFENKIFMKND